MVMALADSVKLLSVLALLLQAVFYLQLDQAERLLL
jgi:ATP-dependent Clp protease adapter protein ClpS